MYPEAVLTVLIGLASCNCIVAGTPVPVPFGMQMISETSFNDLEFGVHVTSVSGRKEGGIRSRLITFELSKEEFALWERIR
jgi:hypothetical protein